MKVLCCDPGLRNLSMCVMDSEYNISFWKNINILDSDDHKCVGIFKNGKVCGRKCSMKYKNENEVFVYSCKTHFPKDTAKTKLNDFKKKNIDEYLLQDIAGAFINKIQNLYDSEDNFKDITGIFIEQQPRCNPKSLFISHILYGKFIELYKDRIPIRFVRASEKLKAYTGPEIKCSLKGAYAKRKWLSVKYGHWFLDNKFSEEQKEKWLPMLTGKCDDLFDAALMCINAVSGIPKKNFSKTPRKTKQIKNKK